MICANNYENVIKFVKAVYRNTLLWTHFFRTGIFKLSVRRQIGRAV